MASEQATERATLVDSNVLLDIFTEDPSWLAWSLDALADAADHGVLVINPVIYAEVAPRFSRVEALDDALDVRVFRRDALPWSAAFLAAQAHLVYRRRGGSRSATLPDFVIGAHAAVNGMRLLTREPSRYRAAFPRLVVLSPS